MKQTDKLYPEALKADAEAVCKKLINDNYTLDGVSKILDVFISSQLNGKGYDAARTQFRDYQLLFKEVQATNQLMIDDLYTLANTVGDEILDGPEIFEKQAIAKSNKEDAESEASAWRSKITDETWAISGWFYEQMAQHFDRLAASYHDEYLLYAKKRKTFNQIENSTKALFESASQRKAQTLAFQGIVKAFQNGSYNISDFSGWRTALYKRNELVPVDWDNKVIENLLAIGMTEEELMILKNEGVVLTASDVDKIKDSKGNTNAVFSEDKTAVIMDGKVYYIYTPTFEVCYDLVYEETNKYASQKDFDWARALTGLEQETFEDGDGNVYSKDGTQLAYEENAMQSGTAGGSGVLFLLNTFNTIVDQGLTIDYINMRFQESGPNRRVTFYVGNDDTTEYMSTRNYNGTINSYKNQDSVMAMQAASGQAKYIYTAVTGCDPEDKQNYTILSELDSRHKDNPYQGTLYYENGNLMYKPIVYSGDKAYVATCDAVSGDNTQVKCEFTDKLDTPVPANQYQGVLEEAMKN